MPFSSELFCLLFLRFIWGFQSMNSDLSDVAHTSFLNLPDHIIFTSEIDLVSRLPVFLQNLVGSSFIHACWKSDIICFSICLLHQTVHYPIFLYPQPGAQCPAHN